MRKKCGFCHKVKRKADTQQLRKQAMATHWKRTAERNAEWSKRSQISDLEVRKKTSSQSPVENQKVYWKHYLWQGMQNFWTQTLNCFK